MSTIHQNSFGDLVAHCNRAQDDQHRMILMVGETQSRQALETHFPARTGLFLVEFADLTRDLLRSILPDTVMSPAFTDTFDCLDLARFLTEAEFKGAYRIVSNGLPRPQIIRSELRSLYPDLNSDFLITTPKSAN